MSDAPPYDTNMSKGFEDLEAVAMQWRFFIGACLLTGALLIPHAGPGPVIGGMVLAAALRWGWSHVGGSNERSR
jgi:hypothetical protein